MIRKLILVLTAATLIGGTATAGNRKHKAEQTNDSKLICKSMEENGQKLRRTRACHTAAEWRELQRQTRAAIEHIQNSRATY
ncbi:MAG TPA: hypothetical protein VK472_00745 [Allosphingosinicella sp.]|nr:hypothetical protein [Allosphingosinicella sp.]